MLKVLGTHCKSFLEVVNNTACYTSEGLKGVIHLVRSNNFPKN